MPDKNPTPDDLIIGQNMRRYRLNARMSQKDVAAILEVSFQQLQKYEKGWNRVSGSRLQQVCGVFGCTINDLFAGTSGSEEPSTLDDPIRKLAHTPKGLEIARLFPWLSPKLQQAIVDICTHTLSGDRLQTRLAVNRLLATVLDDHAPDADGWSTIVPDVVKDKPNDAGPDNMDDPIRKLSSTPMGIRLAVSFLKLPLEMRRPIIEVCEGCGKSEADIRAETTGNVDRIRALAGGTLG